MKNNDGTAGAAKTHAAGRLGSSARKPERVAPAASLLTPLLRRWLGTRLPTTCIAALVLAPAGASATDAGAAEALERHRELWHGSAPQAYEYGYQKFCDCTRDAPPIIHVAVEQSRVVAVNLQPNGFEHTLPADAENFDLYWTIDDLFALIESALDGAAAVRASYDAEHGYPTSLFVDYDDSFIGDEIDLRLTRFEARP